MVLSRNAALVVVLASLLAGCTPLRNQRNSSSAAPAAKATADKKSAATTLAQALPANPAALYIPGSAGAPPTKAINAMPVSLSAPALAETETTLPPLTPTDAASSDHPLQVLADRAAARWASLDAYACRIRRREAIAGQPKPEELMVAKFRKEPYSVYFQFLGPEAKGREVVYVQGQHGNLIHTLTAAGDIPLVPGGSRFKIAPDSLLVKNKTRYPITEAGVGPLVERFGKLVQAVERGDARAGTVKYLGQAKRTEFEHKVEVVLHTIPPGWETQLSLGGKRLWCFDPGHGLPVLIVTYDDANREVEYYCHDRFEFPEHFRDDEFNPEKLWPQKK